MVSHFAKKLLNAPDLRSTGDVFRLLSLRNIGSLLVVFFFSANRCGTCRFSFALHLKFSAVWFSRLIFWLLCQMSFAEVPDYSVYKHLLVNKSKGIAVVTMNR